MHDINQKCWNINAKSIFHCLFQNETKKFSFVTVTYTGEHERCNVKYVCIALWSYGKWKTLTLLIFIYSIRFGPVWNWVTELPNFFQRFVTSEERNKREMCPSCLAKCVKLTSHIFVKLFNFLALTACIEPGRPGHRIVTSFLVLVAKETNTIPKKFNEREEKHLTIRAKRRKKLNVKCMLCFNEQWTLQIVI